MDLIYLSAFEIAFSVESSCNNCTSSSLKSLKRKKKEKKERKKGRKTEKNRQEDCLLLFELEYLGRN